MENSYLKKYADKTELEKLKEFLLATNLYSELLLNDVNPKEVIGIIDEPFLKYLTKKDILNEMEQHHSNYQDEVKKYGLDIEFDALSYACDKLNIDTTNCKSIQKNIEKMKCRK